MTGEEAVKLCIEKEFELRKNHILPSKIHITNDMRMKLLAMKDYLSYFSYDLKGDSDPMLLGYPTIIHYEECEHEIWFEAERHYPELEYAYV